MELRNTQKLAMDMALVGVPYDIYYIYMCIYLLYIYDIYVLVVPNMTTTTGDPGFRGKKTPRKGCFHNNVKQRAGVMRRGFKWTYLGAYDGGV